MKTKLIIAALLTTLSLPVHAEVYGCKVNGTPVFQDRPCAGQVDTAQPMDLNKSNLSVIPDNNIGRHYSSGSSRTYVDSYYRKDGTHVNGYYRRK